MATGFKVRQQGGDGVWVSQAGLTNTGWGTNTVNDGIYANGQYVIVGANCRIAKSTDGVTWTEVGINLRTQFPETSAVTLYNIIWTGTYYFVTGGFTYGSYAYSTDLINWNYKQSSTTASRNPVGIATNGTTYVITISNYMVHTATNPFGTYADWNTNPQHGLNNQSIYIRIFYDSVSSKFIVYSVSVTSTFSTSTDGITWTTSTALTSAGFPNSGISSFIHDGTKYVVTSPTGGIVATSTDLATWTVIGNNILPSSYVYSTYANGRTMLYNYSGNGSYTVSINGGSTWIAGTMPGSYTGSYNTINNIVFCGGNYIMIYGNNGQVWSSVNGITWTQKTTPTTGYGNQISTDGTNLICSFRSNSSNTSHNQMFYSADGGVTWSTKTLPATSGWGCNAYGGGKFIALPTGYSGTTTVGNIGAYSTDGGVTWNSMTLPATGNEWVEAVYSGSLWVAIRYAGTAAMTSTDGINWTAMTLPANLTWNGLNWTGTYFVLTATTGTTSYYSSDGINWNSSTMPYAVTSSVWTGSKVLGVLSGATRYISSSDGVTWDALTGPTTFISTTLRKLNYNGTKYTAVGDSGKVATSTDLTTWTDQTGLSSTTYGTNAANIILWNGTNKYVVAGTSYNVATSADAVTWTYQTGLNSTGWGSDTVNASNYNGSQYIVVGGSGKVATSTDGITWTYQGGLASTTWGVTDSVNAIAWNGTQYVVGGANGKIATSPDGITWTYRNALSLTGFGTRSVNDMHYDVAKNKIVVIGSDAGTQISAVSTDGGVTWTSGSQMGGGYGFYSLAYNGTIYVGGMSASRYAISTDGLNWTGPTILTINYSLLCRVVWFGKVGLFVIVGTNSSGYFYYSADGVNWTQGSGLQINNYYIYNDGNRLFCVGQGTTIYVSYDGKNWSSQGTIASNQYTITGNGDYYVTGGASASLTLGRDNYQVDLDDLLVRRDAFSAGTMWSWGINGSGQLGDGTTSQRNSPVTVSGNGSNWKTVSASAESSSAIKTDGTLWTWGNNQYGTLGTGNTNYYSSPVTVVSGGNNWKQSDIGYAHSAAIKTDGTLWVWGFNGNGELGTGNTSNYSSPVTTAGGGTNWKQVSAGENHAVGIKTDGTLWTWGRNNRGQLGTGNTSNYSSPVTTAGGGTNWKQVSAGYGSFTAAIKTDGTLWSWGNNNAGQLGAGYTTFPNGVNSPVTTAGGGTNWKQVAAGNGHSAAIKTDGSLWTWGINGSGQLGDGTTSNRSSPVTTAGGGTNWKQVSAGENHAVGIKTDGTLWTWGSNLYGQLGDGSNTNRSSPSMVNYGDNDWTIVSAGENHTIALKYIK